MTALKRFRVVAVIALVLTAAPVVASAPAAASPPTADTAAVTSTLLPAPTDLRQIGTDTYGYPILTWTWGSPDAKGTYTVRYHWPAPATSVTDDLAFSSYSGQPYDTFGAAGGFCLPGGTYQVTVYYGSYNDLSAPSNTISIMLPDGPVT